ncbi:DUF4124 domain-containing protein [Spartinivicinus poritis]|uniref:DUF4124 domain-containing protein n=1 Tax=Spartinivicinus poritis TaxID=2994640 RepID=A0ABT5U8E3_9GAMM|nr:DUF4124 domain-containing protein [Spartinivicinus sp. A2-2]MDE1461713.1 DUF4124 domain-containing protein [Spartinivicinus sp. A2-2]
MLKPTSLLWALIAILPWAASYAEIYKTIDKDGKVVFTDNPEGKPAEEVELKKGNTISLPPAKISPSSKSSDINSKSFSYREFNIKKPTQDATIRGSGNFSVLAAISPNLRPGDSVQLYIDGKPYGSKQKGLLFNLNNVDRGTHSIVVKVLNSDGRVLNSASVTVHVHRSSALLDRNKTKQAKGGDASPSLLSRLKALLF